MPASSRHLPRLRKCQPASHAPCPPTVQLMPDLGFGKSAPGNANSAPGNASSAPGIGKSDPGIVKSDLGNAKSDLGFGKSDLGIVKSDLGFGNSYLGVTTHPSRCRWASPPNPAARSAGCPGSNPDVRPLLAFHELPGGAGAAEGVVHWGEVWGLMADPERGRDRVRRGGVDVDRHPRR